MPLNKFQLQSTRKLKMRKLRIFQRVAHARHAENAQVQRNHQAKKRNKQKECTLKEKNTLKFMIFFLLMHLKHFLLNNLCYTHLSEKPAF